MNVDDLSNELADNFVKMKAGEQSLALGKQLANTAGKLLSANKSRHEYNKERGYDIVVPFFEVPPVIESKESIHHEKKWAQAEIKRVDKVLSEPRKRNP